MKSFYRLITITFTILVLCSGIKANNSFTSKRYAIGDAKPIVLYQNQSRPIYKSANGVTFVIYKGSNGKWIKRFITV